MPTLLPTTFPHPLFAPDGAADGDPAGTTPAPEASAAPEASLGALEGDAFRAALPEEFRAHPSLAKIANMSGLLKSFVSSQKMIGSRDSSNLVEWPTEVTSEFRADILGRLGAQTDPAAVTFQIPDGVNPGKFGPDAPLTKGFADVVAKTGILPDQAQAVFTWATSLMHEAQSQSNAQADDLMREQAMALKAELGPAFDQDTQAANFAMHRFGLDELAEPLAKAGLGSHPKLVKALAALGKMVAETPAPDQPNAPTFDSFNQKVSAAEEQSKAAAWTQEAMALPAGDPRRKTLMQQAQKARARALGE